MHDIMEDVNNARTPADMRQALDTLYRIYSTQIDDERIAEAVDNDHERYQRLTIALMRIYSACNRAKALLTDANAAVAVPLVKDLITACIATSSFTASLSPASLELVKTRQIVRDRMAAARAAKPSTRHIIDRAVQEARQRWLDSGKPLPRTPNNFAQRIIGQVNDALAAHGAKPVKESAISKRLLELAKAEGEASQEAAVVDLAARSADATTSLTTDENLFG